jgi:outer membrane protein assembly factor BamE (lipoprotein component of BamABCDE complex)
LDSEDALKAQFEADKAALNKDWERKLKEAVAQATEKTRKEEQEHLDFLDQRNLHLCILLKNVV